MTFSESIASVMGKYGTFNGRASRAEFWWFYLFSVLVGWAASVVGTLTMNDYGDVFSSIVSLALVVPQLAVGSRRLHDTGRSGWWQLLILTLVGLILLIVWWASEGGDQDNAYGSKPAK